MVKSYLLIILLSTINIILADDTMNSVNNDSTNQYNANIHLGGGLINGIRAGINWPISERTTLSTDIGYNPFLYEILILNVDFYYFYTGKFENGFFYSPSYSFWGLHASHIISQNIGYTFHNYSRQSQQLRIGVGVQITKETHTGINIVDGKYKIYILPNIGFIISWYFKG